MTPSWMLTHPAVLESLSAHGWCELKKEHSKIVLDLQTQIKTLQMSTQSLKQKSAAEHASYSGTNESVALSRPSYQQSQSALGSNNRSVTKIRQKRSTFPLDEHDE